jgi:hypothetical protein
MATAESYYQLAQMAVPNTATVVYGPVAADTQVIIKHISVVNPNGESPSWVTIWTAGNSNSNLILPQVTLGDGEFGQNDSVITLQTGDTLEAEAELDDQITITVHGTELLTT